jgi:hypothetical protein
MSYEVFDNYLDKDSFKVLKSVFVNNYNFPWYYNEIITKENLNEEFNLDRHQFTHVLYRENQGVSSDFYQYVVPLVDKINSPLLMRVKANLATRTEKHVEGGFHTDSKLNHKTAVFYLNTNNGYTLFENGEKVESLENRLVVFNSDVLHTGVSQTDTKIRCLLNINYF